MKGYKTFNDIPENTIKQLLKEPVQLELFLKKILYGLER